MMQLKIKRLTDTSIVPEYQSTGAAAFDLHADIDEPVNIQSRHYVQSVPTGLAIQIPRGYAGIIVSRSGLGIRNGLIIAHGFGTVDSDYRGEIFIPIWNRSLEQQRIYPSDRVAQMLIMPVEQVEFNEVDELDGTERGSGGFGSTGI